MSFVFHGWWEVEEPQLHAFRLLPESRCLPGDKGGTFMVDKHRCSVAEVHDRCTPVGLRLNFAHEAHASPAEKCCRPLHTDIIEDFELAKWTGENSGFRELTLQVRTQSRVRRQFQAASQVAAVHSGWLPNGQSLTKLAHTSHQIS